MSVNFKFCGTLKKLNETATFKPVDIKEFESGFTVKTLRFQGVNGSNSHFFQIKSVYWRDAVGEIDSAKTDIYTVSQSDDKKYKQIKVPYASRNDEEIVKSVPSFRKNTVDLNIPGETKDPAKRHDFIFEGDFLTVVSRILDDAELMKHKFAISGEMDIQYSEDKQKFYTNYTVKKLAIAPDDADEEMYITTEVVYNTDSYSDAEYEETGRIYFDAWNKFYDSQYKNDTCKGYGFYPMQFVFIPNGDKKDEQYRVYKSRMSVIPDGAEYGSGKISADVVDGAQVEAITYDDLPDEVKEDIDMGLADLETELRKAGGSGYGDRITEFRMRTFRETQSTDYSTEDICPPSHSETTSSSDEDDIFEL